MSGSLPVLNIPDPQPYSPFNAKTFVTLVTLNWVADGEQLDILLHGELYEVVRGQGLNSSELAAVNDGQVTYIGYWKT